MVVVGVCVRVETEGRPTARAVLLDDSSGTPVLVETFEFSGDDVEYAQQLLDLSKSVATTIKGAGPDRVVIRRADFTPAASRKEAPKLRLLAEGAICASAREQIPDTHLGTGADIGSWDGRGKDAVEADAKALAKASGVPHTKWADAFFAALGALAYR